MGFWFKSLDMHPGLGQPGKNKPKECQLCHVEGATSTRRVGMTTYRVGPKCKRTLSLPRTHKKGFYSNHVSRA